jgi:hypothetical protein
MDKRRLQAASMLRLEQNCHSAAELASAGAEALTMKAWRNVADTKNSTGTYAHLLFSTALIHHKTGAKPSIQGAFCRVASLREPMIMKEAGRCVQAGNLGEGDRATRLVNYQHLLIRRLQRH